MDPLPLVYVTQVDGIEISVFRGGHLRWRALDQRWRAMRPSDSVDVVARALARELAQQLALHNVVGKVEPAGPAPPAPAAGG